LPENSAAPVVEFNENTVLGPDGPVPPSVAVIPFSSIVILFIVIELTVPPMSPFNSKADPVHLMKFASLPAPTMLNLGTLLEDPKNIPSLL
jgi:hypothetical protein